MNSPLYEWVDIVPSNEYILFLLSSTGQTFLFPKIPHICHLRFTVVYIAEELLCLRVQVCIKEIKRYSLMAVLKERGLHSETVTDLNTFILDAYQKHGQSFVNTRYILGATVTNDRMLGWFNNELLHTMVCTKIVSSS